NLVQDTLKCLGSTKKEIEIILSPSSDLDELQELGALDSVISQLAQILKVAESEKIQSRHDVQTAKAIKEPLVLIRESIQSLKPMVSDLSDENKLQASSITDLERSIGDICAVASDIEESVEIVDQPDITQEFAEKLMVLQKPLQKLSIAIGNFKTSLQQPEIKKIDSIPVLSALSAIKQSIELISVEKSEAQSLNVLCQNLRPLSSKIEEIQETMKLEELPRRDQATSTNFKQNLQDLDPVRNIMTNINYVSDRFGSDEIFNDMEIFSKVKESLQHLKIVLGSKEALHKLLEESQREMEETLPKTIDQNAANLVQDTLKCLGSMKKEIEIILSPSSDLDELQELGALDSVISQLAQILKVAESEKIQSRHDVQTAKAIKEPLVLIRESIQSLKPMVSDLSDENKLQASSITDLERSIGDICAVASDIEESVEIVDQPDITQEFAEKLMVLQKPLQKLSIAIGNFKTSLQQPEIKKIDSIPVLSALSAIKQSIELISVEKSEAQSLNVLCQNLRPLSSKIEEIQQTMKLEELPRRDQATSTNFKQNLQDLDQILNNIKSNVGGLKPFDKIMITLTLELQNPIQDFVSNFEEIQKVFDQENLDDISQEAADMFDEIAKVLRENIVVIEKCHKAAVGNQFTQNELAEIKKSLGNIQCALEKSTSVPLETYFMELMHSNLVTMKKSCTQILKQLEKSSLHLSTYETLVKVTGPLKKIVKQIPLLKEKLSKTPALSNFNNLAKIDLPIDEMKAQISSMIALPTFDVYKEINEDHILKIVSLKSTLGKLGRLVGIINNADPEKADQTKEILGLLQESRLEIEIIRSINIKLFENLQTPLETLSDILWSILKELEQKSLYQQLHSDIVPSINQLVETIDTIPVDSDYNIFENFTPTLENLKSQMLKFSEQEETIALKDFIQAVSNVSQPNKTLVGTLVQLKETAD
ncbi:hypothetical protein AMK59_5700, partial [Oryctes borbonicus]